jgi:hypothetical protein
MYADSAPVHSDGLPNEPKRSHLSNLHHTLSSLNHILLSHPPQVNRAYAIPVFDGDGYSTPRVFRSGLTICDEQNNLQLWSTNISSDLPYPLENATRLFISDGVSNLSFCLTFSGMQQAVTVLLCDASSPPVQSWLIKRSTQPGMQYIISSVASPGACIGLDLDSNGNFVSSSLLMQSCDFYDSGLAVSWSLDPAARTAQLTNSFAKSSCLSAIETANVTAFTYGSGSDSATFVVNRDIGSSARFLWSGAHYAVAPGATLILDSDGVVLFDSFNVSDTPIKRTYTPVVGSDELNWQCWSENLTATARRERVHLPNLSPLEQLNVTNDQTDYLFYSTVLVDVPPSATITIDGWRSNAYLVFANGQIVASSFEASHDYDVGKMTVTMPLSSTLQGDFTLSILSVSLGLHNSVNVGRLGSEQESKGIVGSVSIGSVDITNNGWSMLPYLDGELKQV